jgi:hypothetical protein
MDHDKCANTGRGVWMSLFGHYDGTGELSKCLERSKEEFSRLHSYKDKKAFPFERYVTKLKENFFILSKDKDKDLLSGNHKVNIIMKGIESMDASIIAAQTDVYNYRLDFSAATNFLLGLTSNIHSAAQLSIVQLATAGSGTLASAIDSREEAGAGSDALADQANMEVVVTGVVVGKTQDSASRLPASTFRTQPEILQGVTKNGRSWEQLALTLRILHSISNNGRNSGGHNAGHGNKTNMNNQRGTRDMRKKSKPENGIQNWLTVDFLP